MPFLRFSALLFYLLPCLAQYDVLIHGGRVIDGTGNAWFRADIAVQGDTIVAVGALANAASRVRIDATGLVVSPGFIDIHSHGREGIFEHAAAENLIRQGVTTIIEGNDGSSPLPLKPFLEQLRAARIGVNFGSFVGQGTLRTAVMGLVNRAATPAEISKMRDLTRQAMLDGAFGLSTGLFYVPGNFTPPEEVIEIARVAGQLGGMHISHMRNEAEGILESVRGTIRIGELGNMPTQVTHHKIIGKSNWGQSGETLRLIDEARARGVDVTVDQYPYTASSTGTAAMFPQWSLEGGRKSLLERLEAPGQRARIKAGIVKNILENRGSGDPKNVVIASCSFDPKLAGKNLLEIATSQGLKPTVENAAEAVIGLQQKGGCSAIYHAIGEEDVERILRYPNTMIASDGGILAPGNSTPHPRNYGTFARVLGRYVRERRVLTLEDAVRKMSSLSAARLKLTDRGLILRGMKADIAVFDPGTVADRSTFEKPHQYAVGMKAVLVNGIPALLNEKMTGELSGKVLYGPAATSRQ